MLPLSDESKKAFIQACLKRIGHRYCWPTKDNGYSGKELPGSQYPDTNDCSGLVTASLYEASKGTFDRRATWNAARLFANCGAILAPKPGDLCFYGPSKTLVTHVMVYMGDDGPRQPGAGKGEVFGSSGGDHRTVTPEIADQMNANVRFQKSHLYRGDFLAFGRLMTEDE